MNFFKNLFSAFGETEGENNENWQARAVIVLVVIIIALIQLYSEA